MSTPPIHPSPYPQQPKKRSGCLIILVIVGGIAVLGIGGCVIIGGLFVKGVGDVVEKEKAEEKNRLTALSTAKPSTLAPDGELKKKFELMSEFTDVQRENAENEIKGKIVEWTLEVFEVAKNGERYRIQTSSGDKVGTFIDLHPKSPSERTKIESVKTGENITVRGYISGISMRHVELEPAILVP